MPVWKYRSVEEMPEIPRCVFRTNKCLQRMGEIWAREYKARQFSREQQPDDPADTPQAGSVGSS
jgi:hypothetical protein